MALGLTTNAPPWNGHGVRWAISIKHGDACRRPLLPHCRRCCRCCCWLCHVGHGHNHSHFVTHPVATAVGPTGEAELNAAAARKWRIKTKCFRTRQRGRGDVRERERGGEGQREPGLTLGSCRPRAVAGNEDDAAQKLRNK